MPSKTIKRGIFVILDASIGNSFSAPCKGEKHRKNFTIAIPIHYEININ
jgi:hypothetical protein